MLVYVILKLNGSFAVTLLDSGSSLSLIHPVYAKNIRRAVPPIVMFGVSGSDTLTQICDVVINLGEDEIHTEMYVKNDLRKSCLIGNALLLDLGTQIKWKQQQVTFTIAQSISLPVYFCLEKAYQAVIKNSRIQHVQLMNAVGSYKVKKDFILKANEINHIDVELTTQIDTPIIASLAE